MDRIGKGRDVYAAEDSGFSLTPELKASMTVSTEINILPGLYPMSYFNTVLVERILSLSNLVWVPNVETNLEGAALTNRKVGVPQDIGAILALPVGVFPRRGDSYIRPQTPFRIHQLLLHTG